MPFFSYLHSAQKRWQSKTQYSVIRYLCAYWWEGVPHLLPTARLGCAELCTLRTHTESRALGCAALLSMYPPLTPQAAEENGSSVQVATTKAIAPAHVQPPFSEHSSSGWLSAAWIALAETAAPVIPDEADRGSPCRLGFMKYHSDNHV